MKKRILACLLALVMLIGVLPVMALAEDSSAAVSVSKGKAQIGNTVYNTLADAVTAAQSDDTIYLGEGNYTLYGISSDGTTNGKNLTFVGQGADKTSWNIGATVPDPDKYGTEYNGDYSLDGAGTITFKDMKLRSGKADYLGFIRPDKTVVENCTVEGKTFYWGYTSATFTNTTFICPPGDYAIWTYSSPIMTFDNCIFESFGKVVNVYTDYSAGRHDITVNFKDCTVTNTGLSLKPVLNINDSNMGTYKYILNITGNNSVSGVNADDITCSRLFGFGGKSENNTGKTVVNFGGTTVWEKGKMVDDKTYHNSGVTANGVAYTNDVDGSNDSLYAEGYKDNVINVINITPESGWAQQPDGSYERTVTRKCKYCGYTEIVKEVKKDDIVDIIPVILPAISKNETAPKLNTRDHFAYVQGYPDGTVKPAGSITRAEVAAILFRLMDADSRSLYYSTASGFRDVDSTKWYNTYVATLNNAGVITDSRTGYFRPNDAITRAELAAMLAQFAEKKSAAIYFSDVSAGYWAANAIALTANLGWINGYPDGTFGPDKTVTRAELMAMVNRATGRAPESTSALLSGMKTWKDNADTARWYYLDVQEATNSHTYLGAPTETWTSLTATPDWSQYE